MKKNKGKVAKLKLFQNNRLFWKKQKNKKKG